LLTNVTKEIKTLKKEKVVQQEALAFLRYQKALRVLDDLNALMPRSRLEYGGAYFTRAEQKKIAELTVIHESTAKSYPDAYYTKRLATLKATVVDRELGHARLMKR
jgi:hypothetical protein